MTRTLNASMLADIQAQAAEKTELLELQFAGGTTRITTAAVTLSWNGFTWVAVGGHLEVEGFGESAEEGSNGCRLKLSAVDQSILALILGASARGRKAIAYYAHFNPVTGAVVANPLTMFDGYMNDGFVIDESRTPEGAEACEISTRLTSRISEVSKIRGVRTNVHSHQAEIPGASADLFFQNVPALAGKMVYWGMKTPGGQKGSGTTFPGLTNPNTTPWGSPKGGSPWGPTYPPAPPTPNMDPGGI